MRTKQEIKNEKEQLMVKLDREKRLLHSDSILNNRLNENVQKYKKLSDQIQRVINVIEEKQLLKPLLLRYEKELSLHDEGLYFNGVFVPGASFNDSNCFDVFNDINRKLADNLAYILRNWAAFRNHPDAQRMTMTVANMYNTMVAIYRSIEGLCQESASKIRAELEQAQEEATHKIGEIEAEIRRLDDEEECLTAQLEQVREYVTFSDYSRKTAVSDFPAEPIMLPLAYGVDTPVALEWDLSQYNGVQLVVPEKRVEVEDESLCDVIKNVVYQFINHYPAGVAQCALYNIGKMLSLDSFIHGLLQANYDRDDDHKISEDSVVYPSNQSGKDPTRNPTGEAFAEVVDLINQCCATDIFSFNCDNPDAAIPVRLFVVFGCATNDKMHKVAADTIKNARKKGVFLLLVEKTLREVTEETLNRTDSTDVLVNELKNMLTLELSDTAGDLQVVYGEKQYQLAAAKNNADEELAFSDQLLRDIWEWQQRPIPLDKVFDAHKHGNRDFSRNIIIPVGIGERGGIKQLSFSSQDATAHCILYGKTGSGKSSILQAIVLGGAYFYSPEEIEFYLIDMKQGNAFYNEDRGIDYSSLKHVRMMATTCTVIDIRNFIRNIVDTRMNKEKNGGFTDIVSYNATRHGAERAKRTVIIIDEYTQIEDSKCIEDLTKIAEQGRSYGISLVLSSTESKSSTALLGNIGVRIEFKNASPGSLLGSSLRKTDVAFLNARKGNCIVSSDGKPMIKFRAAYMGKQNGMVEQINQKYAAIPTKPAIVFGDTKPILMQYGKDESETSSLSSIRYLCATIGQSIFGQDYGITFDENATEKLLLIGDRHRAQSIEYSLLCSNAKENNYFLDLGGDTPLIFREKAAYAGDKAELESMILKINERYNERKKSNDRTPILVMIHDCERYAEIFLNNKPTNRSEEGTKMKVDASMPHGSSAATDVAIEMPPIEDEQRRKVEDIRQKNDESTKQAIQRKSLQSPMKDGAKYGIYIVVQCGFKHDDNVDKFVGGKVNNVFNHSIVIPSTDGEGQYAKNNLIQALNNMTRADKLKEVIEGKNALTNEDRLRCYHITGKDSQSMIPFEWRK